MEPLTITFSIIEAVFAGLFMLFLVASAAYTFHITESVDKITKNMSTFAFYGSMIFGLLLIGSCLG